MYALANAVSAHVARGARVESHTEAMAIVVYGRRLHPIWQVLNIILTMCTFGLWLAVWLPIDRANREHRFILTVDAYGQVHERSHKQPISMVDKARQRA